MQMMTIVWFRLKKCIHSMHPNKQQASKVAKLKCGGLAPLAAATSRSQAVLLRGITGGSQPVTRQKIAGRNDMKMEAMENRTLLGV